MACVPASVLRTAPARATNPIFSKEVTAAEAVDFPIPMWAARSLCDVGAVSLKCASNVASRCEICLAVVRRFWCREWQAR